MEQVAHAVSDVPPQAPVWYVPAPQVAHAVQVVFWVALQAAAWNWPGAHVEQATQAPLLR